MNYQAPRGTYDRLPQDSKAWEYVIRQFQSIVESYGYGEISTPMFEETELFIRSSGDTSDVVSKEMYTFTDKGDRSLTLKPEGTAGVVRAFNQHKIGAQGGIHRFWYFIPIFRYDRPQKGRCRQGHQVGLELLGSDSVYSDAEVIDITTKFYRALGIDNVTVFINSIGCENARKQYAEAILQHVATYLSTKDEEFNSKTRKNPLRLLDNKDPEIKELMKSAPKIDAYLSEHSKDRFNKLKQVLDTYGINYQVDSTLVRGLDYYNETVFEVTSDTIGAQSSLCGGGRYDNLVKQLGGPTTPSCGVAMGIERALLVMPEREYEQYNLDFFFVAATDSGMNKVIELSNKKRLKGYRCNFDLDFRNIKQQMKLAHRLNSKNVVIIGDDELTKSSVTVKNMENGDQLSISETEFLTNDVGAN